MLVVFPSIFRSEFSRLLGDYSVGVPPVPIPNTEVKPYSPDGTARASVWESRKLPGLKQAHGYCVVRDKTKAPARKVPGAFAFPNCAKLRAVTS